MTALHSFTHNEGSEDDTDCVVCSIASEQEEHIGVFPIPTQKVVIVPISITNEIQEVKPSLITLHLVEFNYCRPPPSLV